MSDAKFATFWNDPELSPYEIACLNTFTANGSEIAVYSYKPISNLPKGVIEKDARSILPADSLSAFPVNGVSSMAHFTDYFRLIMFTKTDEIWADTDILLLRRFDLNIAGDLVGRGQPDLLCTALLRLDPRNPRLHDVIQRVEAMKNTDIKWRAAGSHVLTEVYGAKIGLPEKVFYPVHADSYYKVFLPHYFEECTALCTNAYTLKLWNNRVVKLGVFKRVCPPEGSFLHHVFASTRSDQLFAEIYPADVMQRLVSNAEERVGRDEGVRKLMRIALGSGLSSKFDDTPLSHRI
ncbi:hypothetical protein F0160_28515 [Paraburkholderia sp. JPY303]|uniref:hypothetical protein n=1 Tax=Paraburkholderia atlantica TaxID=2654982 RepID=UPI00159030AC|nr:hypothetical protein [Paraburkholderia atlantica]NUY34408.1 hypothetical protein [Paraburkholderia atlantica]